MERIMLSRRRAGLTQQQLAEAIGVQRAVISKYENGTIEPSITQISRIADALKVSVSYLIGQSEDPQPSAEIDHVIKIQLRAEELRHENEKRQEGAAKLNAAIDEALNRHMDAVKKLCIDPDEVNPHTIPDKINAATEYLIHGKWYIDSRGGGKTD